MKSLILAALIAGGITAANAQDLAQKDVPSVVLNSFKSKFSEATDVEWEREADLFKVDFEIGDKDHDAWLDANGNIRKHKEEVTQNDLPEAVNQKLKSDFNNYSVDEVDKIESNGKVYFEIDLESTSDDREVLFLSDGRVGTEESLRP